MEYNKIRTYEDIITFSRENDNFLSEERLSENSTSIFKSFIKKGNKIFFKIRENEVIFGKRTNRNFFRLMSINDSGKVEIENSFISKKELQDAYNKLKN